MSKYETVAKSVFRQVIKCLSVLLGRETGIVENVNMRGVFLTAINSFIVQVSFFAKDHLVKLERICREDMKSTVIHLINSSIKNIEY